jgi:hypothetical protein
LAQENLALSEELEELRLRVVSAEKKNQSDELLMDQLKLLKSELAAKDKELVSVFNVEILKIGFIRLKLNLLTADWKKSFKKRSNFYASSTSPRKKSSRI